MDARVGTLISQFHNNATNKVRVLAGKPLRIVIKD